MGLGQAPARVSVAATARFAFYSDLEPNLNDALIAAAEARRFRKPALFQGGDEAACFAKLPEAQRAGWDGAVDWYGKAVVPGGSNTQARFLIRAALAGWDEVLRKEDDRAFVEIARGFRAAAAPSYRACRWLAQDVANRAYIAAMVPRLLAFEENIGHRLEKLYGASWAREPIPVDLAETVDFSGANTILRDASRGHVLMSIENPSRAALEIPFHEASHILMGGGAPVRHALEDAAKAAGVRLPGDLWHVVLFYTTGEVVRAVTDAGGGPAYTPMLYEIFDRGTWGEYRKPLERAWRPYVNGGESLEKAAAALVETLRVPALSTF